jgi:hypothetical protein
MTAAGPLAQTVPLAPLPSFIPPPDQVAPCLFNVHMPYGNGYNAPGATSFYNYNQAPYYPWAGQPQPYGYPPPMPPPPAAQPVGPQPPEQKPADPNKQVNETPTDKDLPKQVRDGLPLTPETVELINGQLESPDSSVRQMAAVKLAHVLEGDPEILSKPQFRPYAEALILKVLRDPNSLVRQPLLITMELGNVATPTPPIIAALTKLKMDRGLYNFEPGHIDSILRQFKFQEADRKRKVNEQPNPALQLAQQGRMMPGQTPGAQDLAARGAMPPGGPPPGNVAAFPGGGMMPQGLNPAAQAMMPPGGGRGNVAPFPGMPVMPGMPQRRTV